MRQDGPILFVWAMSLQLLLASLWTLPSKAGSTTAGTRIGVSMEAPSCAATNAMFIDYLYAASSWTSTKPVAFSANGYPAALSSNQSVSCFNKQLAYPAGDYQFYAKGSFDIDISSSANSYNSSRVVISGHQYRGFKPGSLKVAYEANGSQPRRVVTGLISLDFSQEPVKGKYPVCSMGPEVLITLWNLDPSDRADDFHMIRPDYPAWPATQKTPGYPFGQEFLQSLTPFCGIRFGWMAFKNNITNWASRDNPRHWDTRCTAVENMIDMANATGCDMWVCLPFNATADFDKSFAQLVKSKLNPSLHCHYEVSDELWQGTGLPHSINYNIVEQMAERNTPPAGLASFYPAEAWEKHGQAMGACLMQHVLTIQPILGSMGRPMLCGFINWIGYELGGLRYIQKQMGINPGSLLFPYGIAAAPCFGSRVNSNLDALFQDINIGLAKSILPAVQQQAALAKQYGIKACCYKMGQDLNSSASTFNLYDSAQYDPRMRLCYAEYFGILKNNGMDLCNYGAFCAPFGSRGFSGLMESMLELKNPPLNYLTAAELAVDCNCGTASPSQATLVASDANASPADGDSAKGEVNNLAANIGGPMTLYFPRNRLIHRGSVIMQAGNGGNNTAVNPGETPWLQ